MKTFKLILLLLVLFCPVFAVAADKDKVAEIVIGENLKPGMPLADAINLLGTPDSIQARRGTEAQFDSILIDYPKHGVAIQSMTNGASVEGIEAKVAFKGKLLSGIKIGDDFKTLVQSHGAPNSVGNNLVRYSEQGLYFVLDKEKIASVKTFIKDSKLLDFRLANPD